jgi:two-component system response regulator YesN
MTILIVDDQPQVVSGLIRGINWKRCGIQKVLKAYNVADAKKIIQNSNINILLCDIEMPVENGFDLILWIKENQYDIISIFLTAHSDFEYVRKAIQLGGVDYILQPAPYLTIETSIATAVEKVNKNSEIQKYSAYKDIILRNKETLLHSLLTDWVKGEYLTPDYFISDINQLGENISDQSVFCCTYISCQYNEDVDYVNTDVILNSMISDIFDDSKHHLLLIPFDMLHFAFLLHTTVPEDKDIKLVRHNLDTLSESMLREFSCNISIQFSNKFVAINEVPLLFHDFRSKHQLLSPIISKSNNKNTPKNISDNTDLISTYAYSNITEIIDNLNIMIQKNKPDIETLHRYYLDLMQVLSLISNKKNCSLYDLYTSDKRLEKLFLMQSDASLMKSIAEAISEYLQQYVDATITNNSQQKQIETIKQFIRNNIEKDLRRSDIADAVYLNQNYLSTLFKENMNVSLKEYIIMEKMKLARTLLRTTELPVSIIAAKIGYTNFSHFSQTYKKLWGTPPTSERTPPM